MKSQVENLHKGTQDLHFLLVYKLVYYFIPLNSDFHAGEHFKIYHV